MTKQKYAILSHISLGPAQFQPTSVCTSGLLENADKREQSSTSSKSTTTDIFVWTEEQKGDKNLVNSSHVVKDNTKRSPVHLTVLPVSMLIVPSLPVYDLPTAMSSFLSRLNVRYQNVLQSQVKALVFGIVRQKEKRSKAKGDEGTEDEEENKLLREPQSRSVVGERRGTWRQSGYPTSREWQKSRRCHILILEWNMEGQASKLSRVGHSYLIAANARPTAKLLFSSRTGRMRCPSENLHHFALKRKKTAFFACAGCGDTFDRHGGL